MGLSNRKSRTTQKYSGKSWGVKFLKKTKGENPKKLGKGNKRKRTKTIRINTILKNTEIKTEFEETELRGLLNKLGGDKLIKVKKGLKRRKTKIQVEDLTEIVNKILDTSEN